MDRTSRHLPQPATILDRYRSVRANTERLCDPLAVEDYQLQSMPDCSPPKWHLAHTAWFFERFVLAEYDAAFKPFHPRFDFLFNSYYEAIGARWPRAARGLLSRPTVSEVFEYRHAVDAGVEELIGRSHGEELAQITSLIELGLHHEQQHQELLLTDLKHAFALNPLRPVYLPTPDLPAHDLPQSEWISIPEGLHWIGADNAGFLLR